MKPAGNPNDETHGEASMFLWKCAAQRRARRVVNTPGTRAAGSALTIWCSATDPVIGGSGNFVGMVSKPLHGMCGSSWCIKVIHVVLPVPGIAIRRKEQGSLHRGRRGRGQHEVNRLEIAGDAEDCRGLPTRSIPCD